jgi:RNA polymerase sigma-70 factor (ECF subfamily)
MDIPRTAAAEQVAMDNMATESAMALLSKLPEQQAEVIFLRVVAGLDTEAVAEILGRSPGAVRVAAHRGLKKLAALLSGAGVTL